VALKMEMSMKSRDARPLDQKRTASVPYLPNPSEAALLLLLVAEAKDAEAIKTKPNAKKITRFRVSEATLKRVCLRSRISSGFLEEMQEWLFVAGWALIFSGTTYALIQIAAVEGWVRLSSRRITEELESVKNGQFDFESRRPLLNRSMDADEDDADSEDTGDDE
jgi:hypothetical protein